MSMFRQFWVGTQTPETANGIWRFTRAAGGECCQADPQRGGDVAMPTFLAVHPHADRLYAVSETEEGQIVSYRVGSDCSLTLSGVVDSGGSGPCHVLVHPQGQWLYVANYVDGSLGAVELTEAGDVGGQVLVYSHSGSGPVTERQSGPHAHFVMLSPGRDWLIVSDLGTDQLWAYPLNDGMPEDDPVLSDLPPGFGPRHIASWHDKFYLTGELSGQVAVLDWDEAEGRAEVGNIYDLAGEGEQKYPSHIARKANALVVAVRGTNELASFTISDDGDSLTPRGYVRTANWPRHFAIAGPQILVAGERENAVVIHPVTEAGIGEATVKLDVPAPMCILPM